LTLLQGRVTSKYAIANNSKLDDYVRAQLTLMVASLYHASQSSNHWETTSSMQDLAPTTILDGWRTFYRAYRAGQSILLRKNQFIATQLAIVDTTTFQVSHPRPFPRTTHGLSHRISRKNQQAADGERNSLAPIAAQFVFPMN